MKILKIFTYIIIFLFFGFIVFKANIKNFSANGLLFNKTNTNMSISEGNLEGQSRKKNDTDHVLFLKNYQLKNAETIMEEKLDSELAEIIDEAKIQTKNGILNKTIYKLSKLKKYGLVDDKGKSITKFAYDNIEVFDADRDLYKTTINTKSGLINAKGAILIPAKYSSIEKTQNSDILLIKNSKYYGLYDLKTHTIVANTIYKNIEELDKYNWKLFSNKFVGIFYCKNGMFRTAKPKYTDIIQYKTLYKSYSENKEGLISNAGEIISEPVYDDIELINEQDCKKKNVLIFKTKIDERYGIIFYTNDFFTIVSPIYSDVQYKGRVNVLSDGYWRILDNRGNVVKN